MHHRKTHRHRKSRKSRKVRNMLNKTLKQSVSVVKTTSKKYMPKVKSGLETVGSKVVKSGEQSIPYLQSLTRKVFSKFGVSSKKSRRA
jgi:hypothetical protein